METIINNKINIEGYIDLKNTNLKIMLFIIL